VVGCGRSGTTLLRTMLNQHPLIAIPVESLFMVDYLRAADAPIDKLKRLLVSDAEFGEWRMPLTLSDLDDCTSAVDLMNRVHELYLQHEGKPYWGQKTPRFVRHGDLLKRYWPNAKFINMIRDPRAVTNSLINSDLHRSTAYHGAKRWLIDVQAGQRLHEQFPDDVLDVRYEDLVSDAETTLSAICDFLGVPFDAAMLAYQQEGKSGHGDYFEQIHARLDQPLQQDRIEAWRLNLSPTQVALIESIATSALMQQYGYTPDNPQVVVPGGYIRRLKVQGYWNVATRIIDRLANWRRQVWSFFWRKLRLGLFWKDLWQVNY